MNSYTSRYRELVQGLHRCGTVLVLVCKPVFDTSLRRPPWQQVACFPSGSLCARLHGQYILVLAAKTGRGTGMRRFARINLISGWNTGWSHSAVLQGSFRIDLGDLVKVIANMAVGSRARCLEFPPNWWITGFPLPLCYVIIDRLFDRWPDRPLHTYITMWK